MFFFRPVHGLIFISEYVEEPLPKEWSNEDPDEDNIVFTSQVSSLSYLLKMIKAYTKPKFRLSQMPVVLWLY